MFRVCKHCVDSLVGVELNPVDCNVSMNDLENLHP